MKVTRKGTIISALEADWLEMTAYYYKQGFSLIDSFVHWEMLKGKNWIVFRILGWIYQSCLTKKLSMLPIATN